MLLPFYLSVMYFFTPSADEENFKQLPSIASYSTGVNEQEERERVGRKNRNAGNSGVLVCKVPTAL